MLLKHVFLAPFTGGLSLLLEIDSVMSIVADVQDIVDTLEAIANIDEISTVNVGEEMIGHVAETAADKAAESGTRTILDRFQKMSITDSAATGMKSTATTAKTTSQPSGQKSKMTELNNDTKINQGIDPKVAKEISHFVTKVLPKLTSGKKQVSMADVVRIAEEFKKLCPALASGKRIVHCSKCGFPGKNVSTHDKVKGRAGHRELWKQLAASV